MIKKFLDKDFLLNNKVAEELYHDYAALQPIIDYHNHLSPKDIAEDKIFSSITEIWLKGDHYKWRAMRANGIDEKYISGVGNAKEKFEKWAETVPYTMRNPLYHWTHLELQRYFNINELLSPKTAGSIFEQTNSSLQKPNFSTQALLKKMKVEVVCTTDYPEDDLAFHSKLNNSESTIKMLPTFRPDKFLIIDNKDFLVVLSKLEEKTSSSINTFDNLLSALEERIEYFHSRGCLLADHGLSQLYSIDFTGKELDIILQKRINQQQLSQTEIEIFQTSLLFHLAKMYHSKKWVMQFHLGAIRDNNSRLLKSVGADVGCDSIGDYSHAAGISKFLNKLDNIEKLPKTIFYNINPRDNELFATMMGNFNDGTEPGKIQWGSAWWFLDQKDGMEKQINTLSNMGLLSRFIGMLTDSRSFLSFPRHEYFRRILCNIIGQDVHDGLLPHDISWLGNMIEGICYKNARQYLGL